MVGVGVCLLCQMLEGIQFAIIRSCTLGSAHSAQHFLRADVDNIVPLTFPLLSS